MVSHAEDSTRRWLPIGRQVAAAIALLYFANSAIVSPGEWPGIGAVLMALVTMIFWFLPWLWFRAWWVWWPSYLFSTLISVGLVWAITAGWVMQVTQPVPSFSGWPVRLQYLFLCATIFGLFSVWQTAVLAAWRLRQIIPRRKPGKQRRARTTGN